MKYDVVMNVAAHHKDIARLAIEYLRKNTTAAKFYIISTNDVLKNFEYMKDKEDNLEVHLIDEDKLIPGITLNGIKEYLLEHAGNSKQAGWYFQQFRKMAACYIPDISSHYLVWDADTIMLKPISFFSEDAKVLINPESENHLPYFDTINTILGMKQIAEYSFVCGHLMINAAYMGELIDFINDHVKSSRHWVWKIMDSIKPDDLGNKGFSEFETYGNFVLSRHPESFDLRPLRYFRFGAGKFGMRPNKYDLHYLSSTYTYASFETWNHGNKFKILGRKIRSFIVFTKSNFQLLLSKGLSWV